MPCPRLLSLPEVPGDADSIIFIAATNNNEFSLFQDSAYNCSRQAGVCSTGSPPKAPRFSQLLSAQSVISKRY